ncbi:MAG TPA: ATP-binding cassette domain-containing protein [Haliangiales bacterium]|nr:ATP-binding cassette domain-containing protein [Haliangiales bacterium]
MIAIQADAIMKHYGSRAALFGASLAVRAGTIHAVVGENGAGKSTLLRVVYGETRAEGGQLSLKGRAVPLGTHAPRDAIAAGVGMVHQHFMLVPTLSVLDNVVLGREPRRGPFVDVRRAAAEVAEVGKRLGLEGVDRPVEELSVGEQQRAEIVKVLWRGADVILLDEPTAVLTPPEVVALFEVLRALRGEGKTIVIVTHKLDEVVALADETTVLRAGRVVGEFAAGTAADDIARAIVGGTPPVDAPAALTPGDVRLEARDVAIGRAVRGVSLSVRAGEIVGIAGVLGNGQSELMLALAGILRPDAGTIRVGGRRGHIPEDRHARGIILDFTLAENLVLGRQRELAMWLPPLAPLARAALARGRVVPPDPDAHAAELSGGNQQRLVVERELGRPGLEVLLAAEPTRGVDIGASAWIRARIREAAAAGAAVLLGSSDLGELRSLAGRILVFYRGRIAAELPVAEATDERLGAAMLGLSA